MERRQLWADLSLLLVSLIWGGTFVLVKEAIGRAGVFNFLALRFALATLFLALLFWPRLVASSREALRAGAIAGVFLFGGYALQTTGLLYVSVTKAGFITGLSVVMVPALSALILKRPPNRSTLLGVALATIGLAFLSLKGDLTMAPGDLLVLGGAASFALQITILGYFAPRMDAVPLATVQTAMVAIASFPLALSLEGLNFQLEGGVWFAIIFTALLATALALSVQTVAQRFTSPTHTALIFAAEPVFAALFGYLLAGDRLGPRGFLGCLFILLGMLAAELRLLERSRG